MTDEEFDAFIDKIQGEAMDDALNAYGEKGFHRWRNPRFHGRMDDPDGYGRVTGGCGDTMEMFLRIENDRVAADSFTTTGCASSGICGSFAAELATGREVEQIFAMNGDEVLAYIGQFPEAERHCAFLAVETLHEAANGYLVRMAGQQR